MVRFTFTPKVVLVASLRLQWFLRDKALETEEEVKRTLDDFFASKDINFYHRGTHWINVIRHKDKYLIEKTFTFSSIVVSFFTVENSRI